MPPKRAKRAAGLHDYTITRLQDKAKTVLAADNSAFLLSILSSSNREILSKTAFLRLCVFAGILYRCRAT